MTGARLAAWVVAAQLLLYAAEKVYMAAIGRVGLPGMVATDEVNAQYADIPLLQLGNAALGLLGAAIVLATLRHWGPAGRVVLLGALVIVLGFMAAGLVLLSVRGVWTAQAQLPLVALVWPYLVWSYLRRYWRPVLPGAAWVALVCAIAYGGLKLAWAFGATLLMEQTPLAGSDRELLLGDGPVALIVHLATAAIAAVGVLVILALATSWRERVPRWLLLGPTWLAIVFLLVRGVAGVSNDLAVLFGSTHELARFHAGWDLALWSPLWLILGIALLRLTRIGVGRVETA